MVVDCSPSNDDNHIKSNESKQQRGLTQNAITMPRMPGNSGSFVNDGHFLSSDNPMLIKKNNATKIFGGSIKYL